MSGIFVEQTKWLLLNNALDSQQIVSKYNYKFMISVQSEGTQLDRIVKWNHIGLGIDN